MGARAKSPELTLLRIEKPVSERPLSSVPDDDAAKKDTTCLGKRRMQLNTRYTSN